ncbi:DUF6497 family protein [Pseudogemmobacter faecipullorum]|uniref:Acetolactate synthase n=1 Tax=Pseudogemmobacter faecipullorum TaxID=2755041 RepID=A0ABS8CKK9_9RHOB|nr:DUF6497 family protein [Pseudogemmobacter faecipullorum]MCB5409886.1 acetolactate synthase [Pseudogemmobacter faecipullorum]
MAMAGHRVSLLMATVAMLLAGCKEEAAAAQEGLALPSGRPVSFLDIVTDTAGAAGATARFRFIDTTLQQGEDRSEDMQALCDTYALGRVDGMVPAPQQIVITLADRELPYGEAHPEAVQFFEAYGIKNGSCIWEIF